MDPERERERLAISLNIPLDAERTGLHAGELSALRCFATGGANADVAKQIVERERSVRGAPSVGQATEDFDFRELCADPLVPGAQRKQFGWSEVQQILARALTSGERYNPRDFAHDEVYVIPTTSKDTPGARKFRELCSNGFYEAPAIDMYSLSWLVHRPDEQFSRSQHEAFEALIIALRTLGVNAVGFLVNDSRTNECQWLLLAKSNVSMNSRTN